MTQYIKLSLILLIVCLTAFSYAGKEKTLFEAIQKNNERQVQQLLKKKTDVDVYDQNGWSPLHWAVYKGNLNIVKLLIAYKANIHIRPKKAFMLFIDGNFYYGNEKSTPLHIASNMGHTKIVVLLVQKGADLNAKDKYNITPLHGACYGGHTKTAKVLIQKGADLNAKNKIGSTPLEVASRFGHTQIVKLLIQKGADVHGSGKDDWTPLHFALNAEIAKMLIDRGANVNAKSLRGWTPLHVACYFNLFGSPRGFPFPIHINVNAKGVGEWGPKKNFSKFEIAQLLLDKGANVNAKDKENNTPLHFACLASHTKIVKLLIEKGANVNAKNKNGKTPLSHVKDYSKEIKKLLIDNGAKG